MGGGLSCAYGDIHVGVYVLFRTEIHHIYILLVLVYAYDGILVKAVPYGDFQRFPYGVPVLAAEKVVNQLIRNYGYPAIPPELIGGEHAPGQHGGGVGEKVITVYAHHGNVSVKLSLFRLAGSYSFAQGYSQHFAVVVFPEGTEHVVGNVVIFRGYLLVFRGHEHHALRRVSVFILVCLLLYHDGDIARANGLHRIGEFIGHGLAQRHYGNDGTYAYDYAQHGKEGAHLIAAKAVERQHYVFNYQQAYPSFRLLSRRPSG